MKMVLISSSRQSVPPTLFCDLALREEAVVSGGLYESLSLPPQVNPNPNPPTTLDKIPIAQGYDGKPITVGDFVKYLNTIGLL